MKCSLGLALSFCLFVFGSLAGCGGGSGGNPVTPPPTPTPTPTPTTAFKVLLNFNGSNGSNPTGNLIFDSSSKLYGTAGTGGTASNLCENESNGCGVVFKLTPGTGGNWTETNLYSFAGGADGQAPQGGLVFDVQGNLYGVTATGGGGSPNCAEGGCGSVFEITRAAGGTWSKTILHAFAGGSDGVGPVAGLAIDAAGNLYGTTFYGGDPICSCGTVFELSPSAGGQWTLTNLHVFTGTGDGGDPWSQLVFDTQGNLFGTASGNSLSFNPGAYGSVFELSPETGGGWTYAVIHEFAGEPSDGAAPQAGLTVDAQGNLYGATTIGGASDKGTVFKFTRGAGNSWTETILYNFQGATDGQQPWAAPVFDVAGNLYGTTSQGGGSTACGTDDPGVGCGAIYKLAPGSNGGWTESVLYSFSGASDGSVPIASLILDSKGNLYGTAEYGNSDNGVVFMW